jgi:hypothetical protein
MGEIEIVKGETYEIKYLEVPTSTTIVLAKPKEITAGLDKLVIVDDATMVKASELLTTVKQFIKTLEDMREKEIDGPNKLWDRVNDRFKGGLELLKSAKSTLDKKIIDRNIEIEKERAAKQKIADDLAAAEEKKKKDALEKQAQEQRDKEAAALAEAKHLQNLADKQKNEKKKTELEAEAKKQQEIADKAALKAEEKTQAKKIVFIPAAQVMVAKPTIGQTMKDNWVAEVTDLAALVKAVADGIVPITVLKADMTVLNGLARGQMKWPGVRFYNDPQLSQKRQSKNQEQF